MIEIKEKQNCCGCGACEQICPKHSITLMEDYEGFLYPKVDFDSCIDCKLCEKVCHELHPYPTREPKKVLAAFNKNEEIRLKSSSGGIFYLLAEKTISERGVVFGARFDEKWQVVFDFAETMEDVQPFMGSKYVQAKTEGAFKKAEVFLKQGRKVLFSGTPCQIAALNQFLRKEYDNLTTVDFVCHGVPSPKVWRMYLNEVVDSVNKINDVQFRNKSNGWKKFNFALSYSESSKSYSLVSHHRDNQYMKVFLRNITLRPSCYGCKAKSGSSKSDITIADFWGIHKEIPEMDDDKGTGLILVNTKKGELSLDWDKVAAVDSFYEIAAKYNAGLSSYTKMHPKRKQFFDELDSAKSVVCLMDKFLKLTPKQRLKLRIKATKSSIKSLVTSILGGG